MTEIEFKLLQSLRASNLRDDFAVSGTEPTRFSNVGAGDLDPAEAPVQSSAPLLSSAPASRASSSRTGALPRAPVSSSVPVSSSAPVSSSVPVSSSAPVSSSVPVLASAPMLSCAPMLSSSATVLPASSANRERVTEPKRASVDLLYGELTEAVIGAAIEVHRSLGPGQLESTYQRALAKELAFCGIGYRAQVPITSWYRDEPVGEFFADFVVEEKIILELKVVSRILPVHRAQVVSYLRATGHQLGLILNFFVPVLVMGVKRVSP